MGKTSYDKDVILWSQEQAALLRAGQYSQLDIEHLADEIEDVGKSEKRELANRMAVLLAHLLKWRFQPELRSSSWRATIKDQRESIAILIEETPSLKASLRDEKWRRTIWLDARAQARKETGMSADGFPEDCPWTPEQTLSAGWLPDLG